eukprot:CAMPEP_0196574470 /NCGR_PEP_ID=MMETSP1081-20130531/4157_1 /TAXON_ID=36882 /ORGANISM="Pyramimonas amylifera, Strain CCMP720" /LENGTH=155 /DNA_ID=CAMNT_0041892499 /DNA_START=122 /DNA_END=589 /DNA_ORIENTATION=-
MASFAATSSSTVLSAKARVQTRARVSTKVVCKASTEEKTTRRGILSLAAITAVVAATTGNARADLTSDLLAKSELNKALNDKKRLATSGANFARSRTVTDGTCGFPNNLIGCENLAESGKVKYLSEDLALECKGTEAGKTCAAKPNGALPSFMGV